MLNNKKGLSGIILTIIMIGLVLVAVGIVWAVIGGILEGQTESIGISEKCVGIMVKPKSLTCDSSNCVVVLERSLGSSSEAIGGVGVTLSTDDESETETTFEGDILLTKTIEIPTSVMNTEATVRVYFVQDGEEKFCSQITTLE